MEQIAADQLPDVARPSRTPGRPRLPHRRQAVPQPQRHDRRADRHAQQGHAGPDRRLRPLPRPQVRPDPDGRLLLAARHLRQHRSSRRKSRWSAQQPSAARATPTSSKKMARTGAEEPRRLLQRRRGEVGASSASRPAGYLLVAPPAAARTRRRTSRTASKLIAGVQARPRVVPGGPVQVRRENAGLRPAPVVRRAARGPVRPEGRGVLAEIAGTTGQFVGESPVRQQGQGQGRLRARSRPARQPLVVAAFKHVTPESLHSLQDVAEVYGKLFACIDAQGQAPSSRPTATPSEQDLAAVKAGFDDDMVQLFNLPCGSSRPPS